MQRTTKNQLLTLLTRKWQRAHAVPNNTEHYTAEWDRSRSIACYLKKTLILVCLANTLDTDTFNDNAIMCFDQKAKINQ